MTNSVTLQVLKVDQPLGEFFIGAIESRDLVSIATADVRDFEHGDPNTLAGIQRKLTPGRVNELSTYVNLDYATFPTSVVLSVDERCVELQEISGCKGLFNLIISAFEGEDDADTIQLSEAAFIIDGQHRLAGLEKLAHDRTFEVNVSIFVGADLADQAEIFSRVNLAQTKVNKSLVYDLLDYARETSPHKVAHEIAIALNREQGGPLEGRIKRLGVRTPGVDTELLAQATVVNGLLRHLPKDQEKERSKSILGRVWQKETHESWTKRIYVDFYRDEDFVSMLENTTNFFEAVRKKWPNSWNNFDEGMILNRTTGYNALSRFLTDAYTSIVSSPRVVKFGEYYEIFDHVDIQENEFTKENYAPGNAGVAKFYRQLSNALKSDLFRNSSS